MLEGLFGIGSMLFRGVLDAVTAVWPRVIDALSREFSQEIQVLKQNVSKAATGIIEAQHAYLELKRKASRDCMDRTLEEKLREADHDRGEAARRLYESKRDLTVGEMQARPDAFEQTAVTLDRTNLLEHHMGLVRLEKRCPQCGLPMILQQRIGGGGSFADFFWSCPGWYRDQRCRTGMNFAPEDLRLLHRSGVPELEVSRAELQQFAEVPKVKRDIIERMNALAGKADKEARCPEHHLLLVARRKKEHDGTLLDMYFLGCPYFAPDVGEVCGYKVKLKSIAQLAACLHRNEGVGILP